MEEIEAYCSKHSGTESEILRYIYKQTHLQMIYPRMISGHLQGRILSMFSKLLHPDHILEIGTFTGYSSICLAEGLSPSGILHSIEINPEYETMIQNNFIRSGLAEKIQLHIGNALEIIPKFTQMFDLVFIDGDKSQYPEYLNLVYPKIRPGGMLIADNVLWGGKVLSAGSKMDSETAGISEFNELLTTYQQNDLLMLPVRDGLSLMIKQ